LTLNATGGVVFQFYPRSTLFLHLVQWILT